MQENCTAEFLSEHKLAGQPNSVLKRVTKDAMVVAYKNSLGEGGDGKGGTGGFKFDAPAAVKGAVDAAFTFSPPAAGENAAAAVKAPMGNLFGKAPPAEGPSGFAFNFGSPGSAAKGDQEPPHGQKWPPCISCALYSLLWPCPLPPHPIATFAPAGQRR